MRTPNNVSQVGSLGIPTYLLLFRPGSSEGKRLRHSNASGDSRFRKAPVVFLRAQEDPPFQKLIARFLNALTLDHLFTKVFPNDYHLDSKTPDVKYTSCCSRNPIHSPLHLSKDRRWLPSFPKDGYRNRTRQGLIWSPSEKGESQTLIKGNRKWEHIPLPVPSSWR